MVKKNVTTVELNGLTKVQFDKEYNYFFVNNMSGGDVLMSTDLIVEGADGVITIPDGASYGTMHGYATDTVYVKGSGKVQVMGTYSAFSPFKVAAKGGEIKTAVGTNINVKNSVEFPLLGLNVYGKSWQNGTPSADNAVPIESIGDSGSIIVTTHGENLIDPSTVVIGGMDSATGDEITTGSRLRTDFIYVPYTGERTHIVPEGFALVSVYRYDLNKNFQGFNYREEDCYLRFLYKKEDGSAITEEDLTAIRSGLMFSVKANADYEPYKSTTAAITTALPLRGIPVDSGGNYTDKNGKLWFCDTINYNYTSAVKQQRIAVIDSYNGESVGSDYISTTGGLDTGATVIYPAGTVTETPLTTDEISNLRSLATFDSMSNIYNNENADMSVKYLTSKAISDSVMPVIKALGG